MRGAGLPEGRGPPRQSAGCAAHCHVARASMVYSTRCLRGCGGKFWRVGCTCTLEASRELCMSVSCTLRECRPHQGSGFKNVDRMMSQACHCTTTWCGLYVVCQSCRPVNRLYLPTLCGPVGLVWGQQACLRRGVAAQVLDAHTRDQVCARCHFHCPWYTLGCMGMVGRVHAGVLITPALLA
jgi:hypothetical protein